jgi:catechol 2,3-dioxygenase-like lactoylglutathione lyase family enzyme
VASLTSPDSYDVPPEGRNECEGDAAIDHVYIPVADLDRSRARYGVVLGMLGWRELGAFDASDAPEDVPELFGFGDPDYRLGAGGGSSVWLRQGDGRRGGGLCLGLSAPGRATVNAAYAAVTAGAGAIVNPACAAISDRPTTRPTSPTSARTAWKSSSRADLGSGLRVVDEELSGTGWWRLVRCAADRGDENVPHGGEGVVVVGVARLVRADGSDDEGQRRVPVHSESARGQRIRFTAAACC